MRKVWAHEIESNQVLRDVLVELRNRTISLEEEYEYNVEILRNDLSVAQQQIEDLNSKLEDDLHVKAHMSKEHDRMKNELDHTIKSKLDVEKILDSCRNDWQHERTQWVL